MASPSPQSGHRTLACPVGRQRFAAYVPPAPTPRVCGALDRTANASSRCGFPLSPSELPAKNKIFGGSGTVRKAPKKESGCTDATATPIPTLPSPPLFPAMNFPALPISPPSTATISSLQPILSPQLSDLSDIVTDPTSELDAHLLAFLWSSLGPADGSLTGVDPESETSPLPGPTAGRAEPRLAGRQDGRRPRAQRRARSDHGEHREALIRPTGLLSATSGTL